jgi:hypothetical protein
MKQCSRCGIEHNRKNQRYCLTCHAANMRTWRASHPMTEEQRLKDISRSYANTYLKRGKIAPEPCVFCGAKAQMHHPDYSKPLEIIWLCRKHHLRLHDLIGPAV